MSNPPRQYQSATQLVERIAALREGRHPLLLASDVDGVLAPIVPYRGEARADPDALSALSSLADYGVVTCVVTGRALDDAQVMLAQCRGLILVAEHGAIIALPDGRRDDKLPSAAQLAALSAFESLATALAARYLGAEVERKQTSVAVHVRRVPSADRTRAMGELATLATSARSRGLSTIAGRAVLEARVPLADKGEALARVLGRCPPKTVLVYAGDDTTDEPAIALAASRGLGVYVASSERPVAPAIAGVITTDQAGWVGALVLLAKTLQR
jgi:trehalose-phosphatase